METRYLPKHFKKHYRRLRKAQKSLSRKQKGSKNREKARIKVAKIHAQITDSRKDHLHKLTTQLVRENQTIVVENLAVKNMVKNSKLSQAISDVSWGEITRQLAYKCRWYGRNYLEVDRWFPSSKRCSNCGYIAEKMPLNVREWDCPDCGTHHDRDINASKNILAAGLAVSVCRATIRPEQSKSVKAGAEPRKGKKQKPKSWGLGITVRLRRWGCQSPQATETSKERIATLSINQLWIYSNTKLRKYLLR